MAPSSYVSLYEEGAVMRRTIERIDRLMASILNDEQASELHAVLVACLVGEGAASSGRKTVVEYVELFLAAKRLEGCSERSLRYYASTLARFSAKVVKSAHDVTTDDIRDYLMDYSGDGRVGKITVDNIRRVISSFFSWLEEEDYIYKSPVRRIKKIRTSRVLKPVYSDESLELLRDSCEEVRDLAMIDLLSSTGIRVGELVQLNRRDIDFDARECVVHGKGDKERRVYFDARAKMHLLAYFELREDDTPALFVSLHRPYRRLEISGVEARLRKLGEDAGVKHVHPHKFRRTLATKAIDKGMPIEQVQVLLGHSKIDTTLCYAMVDQDNVKRSHRKYIS